VTIVIDTSVIVKWFVEEEGHEEALRLLQSGERRLCPDVALAETANVLRRRLRMKVISHKQMADAIRRMPVYLKNVTPSVELLKDACDLAEKVDHSVYDCMFLALARREVDAVVVTADKIFLKKCVVAGFGDSIRQLEDHAALTQAKPELPNG
jgi:predicted nucleic acid-binding protein